MGGGLGWRGRALGWWSVCVAVSGLAAAAVEGPGPITRVEATGGDTSVARPLDVPDHDPDLPLPPTTSTVVPVLEAPDAPPADVDDGLGPGSEPDGEAVVTVRWDPDGLGLGLPVLPLPADRPPSSLPPGTVRITVVDDSGARLPGACVDLWAFPAGDSGPQDSPERTRNGVTGDDGSFTASFNLSQPPPGYPPYFPPLISVTVRPCGVPADFFFDGGILEPGILQEVTVPVVRTARLTGRLLVDGAPAAGQCVTAWTIDPQPDDGSITVTGPGIVEADPVQVARSVTAADGSIRLGGFAGGRTAHLGVSEGCEGPAGEPTVAARGYEFWPQGMLGAVVIGPDVPLGGPGTTTSVTAEVRAIGDDLADAPLMDAPFYGIGTYLATRQVEDPVPSCAPEAAGATVWRRAAYSGERIGFGIRVDRAAVVAAYGPGGGGLVEVGCVVLADGENRNGLWSLPPGAVVLVQGLTGTTTGTFTHFPF